MKNRYLRLHRHNVQKFESKNEDKKAEIIVIQTPHKVPMKSCQKIENLEWNNIGREI